MFLNNRGLTKNKLRFTNEPPPLTSKDYISEIIPIFLSRGLGTTAIENLKISWQICRLEGTKPNWLDPTQSISVPKIFSGSFLNTFRALFLATMNHLDMLFPIPPYMFRGLIGNLILYPIETYRTRQAIMNCGSTLKTGNLGFFSSLKENGIRDLYLGFGLSVFSVYLEKNLSQMLFRSIMWFIVKIPQVSPFTVRLIWFTCLGTTRILMNPFELIRRLIQLRICSGVRESANYIYKRKGKRGFFEGVLFLLPEVLLVTVLTKVASQITNYFLGNE